MHLNIVFKLWSVSCGKRPLPPPPPPGQEEEAKCSGETSQEAKNRGELPRRCVFQRWRQRGQHVPGKSSLLWHWCCNARYQGRITRPVSTGVWFLYLVDGWGFELPLICNSLNWIWLGFCYQKQSGVVCEQGSHSNPVTSSLIYLTLANWNYVRGIISADLQTITRGTSTCAAYCLLWSALACLWLNIACIEHLVEMYKCFVCACVRVCVCACVRVRVRVCVCVCVCVCAQDWEDEVRHCQGLQREGADWHPWVLDGPVGGNEAGEERWATFKTHLTHVMNLQSWPHPKHTFLTLPWLPRASSLPCSSWVTCCIWLTLLHPHLLCLALCQQCSEDYHTCRSGLV